MQWVLNTYITCQDWEVSRIIEVCTRTGYAGVEFLMDYSQRHGVEADASPTYVQSVARQVTDAGLVVSALSSCQTFDSPDAAACRASIDKVRRVIDHAARIGCARVRVLGDRLPAEATARERILDQIGASLGELASYAAPHGIAVSIEMHGDFIDPVLALAVRTRAGQPNVGFVFNSVWRVGAETGWSLPAGALSIKPLYDLTGQYYTSVHTHAMEQPADLGYYRELFRLLRQSGYQGHVSNECAYSGPDPEKVLRMYTALFQTMTVAPQEGA